MEGGERAVFAHPGVLVGKPQLDFVKAKIAAGGEPWSSQLRRAIGSYCGKPAYVPRTAVAVVVCGNAAAPADVGCVDLVNDALAAYTKALIWYHTGDRSYADQAIAIMNNWSAALQDVKFDPGDPTTFTGPLYAAWAGELFPRAAEVIRYSGAGWAESDAARFGAMLTRAVAPRVADGWKGPGIDWQASMADATVNIAVYNNDRALFEKGVALWRGYVVEAIYLPSDGPAPVAPPNVAGACGAWQSPAALDRYWYGQHAFGAPSYTGMLEQTCDTGPSPAQQTLSSLTNVAETARLQGIDLYGEQATRLTAGFEFMARNLNRVVPSAPSPGNVSTYSRSVVVDGLCGGTPLPLHELPTFEIAYNHFVNRAHLAMPETEATIARVRQYVTPYTTNSMAWEEFTHAETGGAPLP